MWASFPSDVEQVAHIALHDAVALYGKFKPATVK